MARSEEGLAATRAQSDLVSPLALALVKSRTPLLHITFQYWNRGPYPYRSEKCGVFTGEEGALTGNAYLFLP